VNQFDVLILIGRPGAGKSEIIAYLKSRSEDERLRRFGIGPFVEIDDFPMLWAWFEEDAILQRMGHERLHSSPDGYFLFQDLWNVLIRRLDLEYHKFLADHRQDAAPKTAIVEFSRGSEHGGFRDAFTHFSEDILSKAAVMYIDVSWEESLRKNRKRFNPDRPHSILQHGLEDEKLERLYKASDWDDFSRGEPGYLRVAEARIPYAVFPNDDDVTTRGGPALGARLEDCLSELLQRYLLR